MEWSGSCRRLGARRRSTTAWHSRRTCRASNRDAIGVQARTASILRQVRTSTRSTRPRVVPTTVSGNSEVPICWHEGHVWWQLFCGVWAVAATGISAAGRPSLPFQRFPPYGGPCARFPEARVMYGRRPRCKGKESDLFAKRHGAVMYPASKVQPFWAAGPDVIR
jgi:hypothetical protein